MRRPAPLLLALVAALALSAGASADVVTLKNGNKISGQVTKADDKEVVIRTPEGVVKFPRAMVASVQTQSAAATLLEMARDRMASGSEDEADALFERAARSDDPEVAKRARTELEAYRARRARAKAFTPAPTTPLPVPTEVGEVKPVEGQTPQDDLDRARRALETGDGGRARRLLLPFVEKAPESKTLRYLLGRACELDRDPRAAQAEYERVLGPALARGRRDVPWLGELARRVTASEKLEADSPGVGGDWQRVETAHFAVFHPFKTVEPWFATEPEAALHDVQERLRIQEHETVLHGRIQVILYPTAEAYKAATGMERAGGHAEQHAAPDGRLIIIRAYPERRFYRATYRHEIAHALLYGLHPLLPSWAHEGAATYCEPLRERAFHRRIYAGRAKQEKLPDLFALLNDEVPRGATVDDVRTYYGVCCVTFEALVGLRNGAPRDALQACLRLRKDGPARGLQMLQLEKQQLLDAALRVAQDQSVPPDEGD